MTGGAGGGEDSCPELLELELPDDELESLDDDPDEPDAPEDPDPESTEAGAGPLESELELPDDEPVPVEPEEPVPVDELGPGCIGGGASLTPAPFTDISTFGLQRTSPKMRKAIVNKRTILNHS